MMTNTNTNRPANLPTNTSIRETGPGRFSIDSAARTVHGRKAEIEALKAAREAFKVWAAETYPGAAVSFRTFEGKISTPIYSESRWLMCWRSVGIVREG